MELDLGLDINPMKQYTRNMRKQQVTKPEVATSIDHRSRTRQREFGSDVIANTLTRLFVLVLMNAPESFHDGTPGINQNFDLPILRD
jgi:hypothetical protein